MLKVLFILTLLTFGTLGFIAAATLALYTFATVRARMKAWRSGRKESDPARRILRDPVYGTVIDTATGTITPPEGGMPFPCERPAARKDTVAIATDLAGTIRSVSQGAENFLGSENAIEPDRNVTELFLPSELDIMSSLLRASGKKDVEGFNGLVSECLGGSLEEQEWSWVRGDAKPLSVTLTITALRDDANQVEGFFFVARRTADTRVATGTAPAAAVRPVEFPPVTETAASRTAAPEMCRASCPQ